MAQLRHRAVIVMAITILGTAQYAEAGADIRSLAEQFFRDPTYENLKISPDGSHLALICPRKNQKVLGTLDIETQKLKTVSGQPGWDISSYDWVDEDNLIFSVSRQGVYFVGLWTVDEEMNHNRRLMEGRFVRMLDSVRKREDTALVISHPRERLYPDVMRINTRTGGETLELRNPGKVHEWLTDDSGAVRIGIVYRGESSHDLLHRFPGEKEWRILDLLEEAIPLAVDSANATLLLSERRGRDTAAFRFFDLKNGKFMGDPLTDPVYDIGDYGTAVIRDQGTNVAIGIRYHREKPNVVYFNESYRLLHEQINAALPGLSARIHGIHKGKYLVVEVESDVRPRTCYLLDIETRQMGPLLLSRAWLPEENNSPMRPVSFAARDGVTVHGYLTIPKGRGEGPFPLIMNIHGGPRVRDTWRFNPEVQYLARLGYAVFQVNYRGSAGYGRTYRGDNLLDACRRVITDVADAARWAVSKGHADPSRIAIFGGSFGGYAALAGAAFEPDLYRCAIGYAGVYDWVYQLKEDKRERWMRKMTHGWQGDYYLDHEEYGEEYNRLSPRFAADRICAPILLIHGGADFRIWEKQAKLMRKALREAGKEVEMETNIWGVHGLPDEKSRIRFYVTVAKFLEQHLQ